ncbi:TM1266 family iron-only hydrogenase system putative regulator [Miniphocaeibacter halophilus]|uniref:Iron-only hydrogenase system regulator n=1 Tax=Miniphocaeibacter halophilus TaxID=2931922 RepID=A0AC61MSL8_9FIRM|nr:TM1266 family iron-only hydrogenase system putative regulator [Miniphocaeibacter halophilus]QQK08308.1 iron-only hydrogenase system regulator [Miniphocaeibacter halophilus]
MDNRVAIIGIIIENKEASTEVNEILHKYSKYIIGRMGIPNIRESINVISVIVDAPQSEISALTGKLGMIKDVSCKAVYSKI